MKKIKLGFAPTRRSIFSAPDAVKYRGLTAQRLKELGVDFVDITDINEEGLLYDDKDVDKISHTVISVHNTSVQDWQRNWMFRCFCGDRWMRDRSQTV